MKKHIPNILTLFNLLSGLIALLFVFKQQWSLVAVFVGLGIIFDYLDGFAARLLKVASPVGLQLDSLADMVTSGLVPAFTMFFLIQNLLSIDVIYDFKWDFKHLLPFSGLAIALGSALRLAKFNVDERQITSFIGLPTPANALFIIAIPLVLISQTAGYRLFQSPYTLSFISILSAYILNADIALFSLKFKDFSWSHNKEKYILLGSALLLIPVFKFSGIIMIILLYVFLSIVFNTFKKKDEN